MRSFALTPTAEFCVAARRTEGGGPVAHRDVHLWTRAQASTGWQVPPVRSPGGHPGALLGLTLWFQN